MPQYKYTGSGMRVGSAEIVHGSIVSLPAPPNRQFELVEEEPIDQPQKGKVVKSKFTSSDTEVSEQKV